MRNENTKHSNKKAIEAFKIKLPQNALSTLEPTFKNRKTLYFKFIASFVAGIFFFTQVTYGYDFSQLPTGTYQPAKEIEQTIPEEEVLEPPTLTETEAFLQEDFPLSPVKEQIEKIEKEVAYVFSGTKQNEGYEFDRYDFEEALDLLRPDFATALILKSLTKENIETLVDLEIEVGIIALHGEVVLFTSGSSDELGVLPAVKDLVEQASFISHTHPGERNLEGPSAYDIEHAVEAPNEEYVITQKGVYAFNQEGVVNEGYPYTYEAYLYQLNEALKASDPNQIQARRDLNTFIKEQDRYNEATEEEKEILREGGVGSILIYDENGLIIQKIYRVYYDTGEVMKEWITHYAEPVENDQDGVRNFEEYREFTVEGILTKYGESTYYAGGFQTKTYDDTRYRADGSVSFTEHYEYDEETGYRTSTLQTTYHENGVVIKSYHTYLNNKYATWHNEWYDPQGYLIVITDATHQSNGMYMEVYDSTTYRQDGTKEQQIHRTFDANGQYATHLETTYDASENTKTTDYIEYTDGKKVSRHYERFLDPDWLLETLDQTFHPGTSYPAEGHGYNYASDGRVRSYTHSICDANGKYLTVDIEDYHLNGNVNWDTHYDYDAGKKILWHSDVYDEAGNLIKTVDSTYHPDGRKLKDYHTTNYRIDGTKEDYYRAVFDETGHFISRELEYYREDGSLDFKDIHLFENWKRTSWVHEEFDEAGNLQKRNTSLYIPGLFDPYQYDSYDYFADGTVQSYYHAEYNLDTSFVVESTETYHSNDQLQFTDIHSYDNGVKTARDYDEYDASGNLVKTIDAAYEPGTSNYASYEDYEYDAQGRLIRYEDLSRILNFEYDDQDRITKVTEQSKKECLKGTVCTPEENDPTVYELNYETEIMRVIAPMTAPEVYQFELETLLIGEPSSGTGVTLLTWEVSPSRYVLSGELLPGMPADPEHLQRAKEILGDTVVAGYIVDPCVYGEMVACPMGAPYRVNFFDQNGNLVGYSLGMNTVSPEFQREEWYLGEALIAVFYKDGRELHYENGLLIHYEDLERSLVFEYDDQDRLIRIEEFSKITPDVACESDDLVCLREVSGHRIYNLDRATSQMRVDYGYGLVKGFDFELQEFDYDPVLDSVDLSLTWQNQDKFLVLSGELLYTEETLADGTVLVTDRDGNLIKKFIYHSNGNLFKYYEYRRIRG